MSKALPAVLICTLLVGGATLVRSAEETTVGDRDLAADLALLQGSWELLHGNDGKGQPDTRSVKTIDGNKETLRRYSAKTGELLREHTVEFQLSKSGAVRVLTFFAVGGSPRRGLSYVYKVDKDNFYDIPGLLHGDEYRNYGPAPQVWHWKRIPEEERPTTRADAESTERP